MMYKLYTTHPPPHTHYAGSQVHYRHCPTDTYSQQQIRYTLDYRVENRSSRNHHTHFVSKTAMSPDCDSLFTQGPFPLSPLATPNQGFYYSATEADFSSLYDFPSQSSMDSTSYDMYGSSSSSEDLTSPVFTKMADSQGGTSELLSLDELSNSGLGYDGYLGCSGGMLIPIHEHHTLLSVLVRFCCVLEVNDCSLFLSLSFSLQLRMVLIRTG